MHDSPEATGDAAQTQSDTLKNTSPASNPVANLVLPYHEAGHAMMAMILGRPFAEITVVPTDESYGSLVSVLRLNLNIKKDHYTRQEKHAVLEDILIGFAGPLAALNACIVNG